MTAKLLALLTALLLLGAACGPGSSDEAISTADPATADAPAEEGTDGTVDGTATSDATDDATDDVTDDSAGVDPGADGADAYGDPVDVEPGSADDRSLVDESSGPVGALLFADTIDGPSAPSSAGFEGRMLFVGGPDSEFAGSYEITMSGAFDIPAGASDLTIDMGELIAVAAEAEGEQIPAAMRDLLTEPMRIIVIEELGWLKWPLLSMLSGSTSGGDLWIELEADEVADTTESFGFASTAGDPTAMLERLAAAQASVEDLGVETVSGVEARHWRALLDLETLAAEATEEDRAELDAQFGDLAVAEFPLDVWIGVEDGYIYRYVLELSSDAVFAQDGPSDFDAVTVTFDFFGYNADQGISPPPADQVTSGEELFSGAFTPGLGG